MKRPFLGYVAMGLAAVSLVASAGCTRVPTLAEHQTQQNHKSARLTTPVIAQEGILTVGINTASAPLAMTDAEGYLDGYSVDLACSIADELGLGIQFINVGDASVALNDKNVDLYIGTSNVDPDTSKDLHVAGTVYTEAMGVFGKHDTRSVVTVDQLAGSTIAVQKESESFKMLMDSGIESNVVQCENINECFDALFAGKADYVICSAVSGAYLSRANSEVNLCGVFGDADTYGIATSSIDLRGEIEMVLDELSNNGVLNAIFVRWFGDAPIDMSSLVIEGVTFTASDEEEAQVDEDTQNSEDTADSSNSNTSGTSR